MHPQRKAADVSGAGISLCLLLFLGGLKSLESNSWTRRKLVGATHDNARAQRVTDPLTVKAARQTDRPTSILAIRLSPKRLRVSPNCFAGLRILPFCLPADVTLKTFIGVYACWCANAVGRFCRRAKTRRLWKRKTCQGINFMGRYIHRFQWRRETKTYKKKEAGPLFPA